MTTQQRRKRSTPELDARMHIVYGLIINGMEYVGVTSKTAPTVADSVWGRLSKHWYRAQTENKDWLLCQALRQLECRTEVEVVIHSIVQGKAAGHAEEVRIRRLTRPILNSDCRGDAELDAVIV